MTTLEAAIQRLALYETALNALDDAVTIRDHSGAVVFQNRVAAGSDLDAADSPLLLVKTASLLPALAAADVAPASSVTSAPTGEGSSGSTASGGQFSLEVHCSLTRHPMIERVLNAQQANIWVRGAGAGGAVEFASKWWCDHVGISPQEVVTHDCMRVVHPDDAPALAAFRASLATATAAASPLPQLEYRRQMSDGVYRWLRCAVSPLCNDKGIVVKWLAVATDIDDLKQAHARLATKRALLVSIIDELPVAVGVAAAPTGQSILHNRKTAEMFPAFAGMQSAAAYDGASTILDATGKELLGDRWPLVRAMNGEHVHAETFEKVLPGGDRRRFRLWASPVRAVDGTIIAATFSAEDITYAIQMEEERARRTATTQLLSNASHELRTPLNGIAAMSELLSHSPLTEEQREQLQCIADCTRLMIAMVEDLLDFNTLATDKLELEAVPLRPLAIASSCALAVQAQAASKGLTLTTAVSGLRDITVIGDPARLKQIVVHLLSNAIKFTPTGGAIHMHGCVVDACGAEETVPPSVGLRFEITDTGIGIAESAFGRIWAPFSQADNSTTRKYGGAGMGLTIVKQLVALMQGEAGVSSVVGTGSTVWFTVCLPIAAALSRRASGGAGTSSSSGVPPLRLRRSTGTYTSAAALGPGGSASTGHSSDDGIAGGESPPAAAPAVEAALRILSPRLTSVADPTSVSPLYTPPCMVATAPGSPTPPATAQQVVAMAAGTLARIRSFSAAAPVPHAGESTSRGGDGTPKPPTPMLAPASAAAGVASQAAPFSLAGPATGGAAAHATPRDRVPHLLVAEDNPTNVLVMKRMLQKLGYRDQISVAVNGQLAVEAVTERPVDLVLMDCHMDVMDGFEACRAIRALGGPKAAVPVVAVTASFMEDDRRACEAVGMNAFIPKPLTLARLADVLHRLLPADCVQPRM